jgi:hypothetical protein
LAILSNELSAGVLNIRYLRKADSLSSSLSGIIFFPNVLSMAIILFLCGSGLSLNAANMRILALLTTCNMV